MRQNRKIIIMSFVFGLGVCFLDVVLDYYFFYEGTFFDLLLLNVPNHEIYVRLLLLISFIIFGFIVANIVTQLDIEKCTLVTRERNLDIILNSTSDPVVRLDKKFRHIFANDAVYQTTGLTPDQYIGKTDEEIGVPENLCLIFRDTHQKVFDTGKHENLIFNYQTDKDGEHTFHASISPEFNVSGEVETIVSFIRNISELKESEAKKDSLIVELNTALEKVQQLEGLLPICSHCKNIRDNEGLWHPIESHIKRHVDVDFSHGICPSCVKKYYSEYLD